MAKLIEFEMWKVGHLVSRDDAIDNGRAGDIERLVDFGVQLAGLRGPKSMAAAGARQRREIRVDDLVESARVAAAAGMVGHADEIAVVVDAQTTRGLSAKRYYVWRCSILGRKGSPSDPSF